MARCIQMSNFTRLFVLLILSSLVFAWSTAAQTTVTDEVKKVVDKVVSIVSDKELQKPENEQKRQNALKNAISAIFDYAEMAERSMGRHWKERTPAEKKEFVKLFETLLENSYAGAIESYNDEKIVYLKETVDGEYAEVNSKVVTAKRDEFSIDYRLMNKEGKWVVYDVVNEGVSLVDNYRTQFNKIIRNQGYAELVKKLKSKSDEITAPRKDISGGIMAVFPLFPDLLPLLEEDHVRPASSHLPRGRGELGHHPLPPLPEPAGHSTLQDRFAGRPVTLAGDDQDRPLAAVVGPGDERRQAFQGFVPGEAVKVELEIDPDRPPLELAQPVHG